jgi:Transposase DDE domain
MTHDTSCEPLCPSNEHTQSLITALLSQACLAANQQVSKRAPGRQATLSGPHLALGVVSHLVDGWQSRLELWRRLRFEATGPFAPVQISNQAVYERLANHGIDLMQHLFTLVNEHLTPRTIATEDRSLAPFAPLVLAMDESVLDTMLRRFPYKEELGHRAPRPLLPPGRIAALFNIRTQQWHRVDVLPDGQANCKVHVRTLLFGLPAGTLVLFDRGYTCFSFFDELTTAGLRWVTRASKATGYPIVHAFVHRDDLFDGLVRVGRYRSDHAGYTVRLVRFRCHGQWHSYLTNVLDPLQLSAADVIRLYARRWDIELAFRVLQEHLQLHTHWSQDWPVLALQVWASLIVAQVYHALQVAVAAEADCEVFDVSLALLVRWVPRLLAQGRNPMEVLLCQGREMGIIRPSRRQPLDLPTVHLEEIFWPPDDVCLWQPPRYAHKKAGNKNRKGENENKKASTKAQDSCAS